MKVPVTGNYEVDSAAVKAALEAQRIKAAATETAKQTGRVVDRQAHRIRGRWLRARATLRRAARSVVGLGVNVALAAKEAAVAMLAGHIERRR